MNRADEESASAILDSPVGPLFARAHAGTLTQLSFSRGSSPVTPHGQRRSASRDVIDAVRAQLHEYFAARRTEFDVPLKLIGPPFHIRVWEALRAIPYGKTMAYGELAAKLGDHGAARAVGAANAANPIVIIVPCHRVIGADGTLVGFGGGLQRKRLLLDLESGKTALDLVAFAVPN